MPLEPIQQLILTIARLQRREADNILEAPPELGVPVAQARPHIRTHAGSGQAHCGGQQLVEHLDQLAGRTSRRRRRVVQLVGEARRKLTQRGHLLPLAQLFLDATPVADVDECDHATHQLAVTLHRVRPVLGRKGLAIRAEHHLIIDVRPLVLPKRLVDAALLDRVRLPVGPGVVHQVVHVLAQQLVDAVVAQQPGAGGVGERAVAVQIDPVDPLTRRVEQQPHLLVRLPQRSLSFSLLGDVRAENENQIALEVAPVREIVVPAPDAPLEDARPGGFEDLFPDFLADIRTDIEPAGADELGPEHVVGRRVGHQYISTPIEAQDRSRIHLREASHLGDGGRLFGEQLLAAPPLADVHERDHTPQQLTVTLNRVGPVLGRKARTVFAEHHLVVHMRTRVLTERLVDATFLFRIGLSVRPGVVDQLRACSDPVSRCRSRSRAASGTRGWRTCTSPSDRPRRSPRPWNPAAAEPARRCRRGRLLSSNDRTVNPRYRSSGLTLSCLRLSRFADTRVRSHGNRSP